MYAFEISFGILCYVKRAQCFELINTYIGAALRQNNLELYAHPIAKY